MTTTEAVPIAITCPDWCEVDPEEHAADLWEMDGNVVHSAGELWVDDPIGYREALEPTRLHARITLEVTAMTRPDGREVASPVVYLDGREHSPEQMALLAKVIAVALERYRAG